MIQHPLRTMGAAHLPDKAAGTKKNGQRVAGHSNYMRLKAYFFAFLAAFGVTGFVAASTHLPFL